MLDSYNNQVKLLVRCLPIIESEKCFAIKGGTAINLFCLNLPRLSVDIDLVYLPIESRETTIQNIHAALSRIASQLQRIGLITQTNNRIEEKLLCSDGTSTIKIEPNYISRGYIYQPQKMTLCQKAQELYGYAEGQIISKPELWGGKICAALDRQHPRDLFDISNLLKESKITSEIKNGFISSLLSAPRPIHELLSPRFHLTEETVLNEFKGMSDVSFSYQDTETIFFKLVETINNALTYEDKNMLLNFVQLKADLSLSSIPNLDVLPGIKWKEINLQNLKLNDSNKFRKLSIELQTVLKI